MWAEFDRLEFEDRCGTIRTFYGCSALGAIEFDERQRELAEVLQAQKEDISIESLYRTSKRIRHIVNRLLELNGIDPDWLTWGMISQLLFGRKEESGTITEGFLISLNRPAAKDDDGSGEPLTTKAQIVAAIALQCSSIEEALRLAETIPAKTLFPVLDAKAEMQMPPEQRQKKEFKKVLAKNRDALAENAERLAQMQKMRAA